MAPRLRAPVLTGVVGLLMALAWSWVPHFWSDERATLRAARLPWDSLGPFLRDRDAVHGVYYVIMHPWLEVFGSSHLAARFPSAVAIAMAVAGVSAIGYRLSGERVAVSSGLVMAFLPVTSHYGMEARSYALTCALVVWAGYFLLRASDPGTARHWWVGYAILLFAAGAVLIYALLIGLAHTVSLAMARLAVRVQLAILAVVAVALGPLILLSAGQSDQVSWISRVIKQNVVAAPLSWVVSVPQPGAELGARTDLFLHSAAVLLGVFLWLLVLKAVVSRWRERGPGMDVLTMAFPWLVLPAAILIGASVVRPMFVERYVFFSAPAFALLIGYALAQLSARALAACIVVMALLAAPLWIADRQPLSKTGHPVAARPAIHLTVELPAVDGRTAD